LWDLRCKKKRALEKLVRYAGKQKVLDSFFAGLTGPGQKPVIAYGAASFHHPGRGEMRVLVKGVLEVCCKHSRTVLVNEHLTTKVHYACGQRLNPLARRSAEGGAGNHFGWCHLFFQGFRFSSLTALFLFCRGVPLGIVIY
jgi:hypothetical protein